VEGNTEEEQEPEQDWRGIYGAIKR
jgi:hypothetical protein